MESRALRRHSISTKLLVSAILWVVCAVVFTGYALALLWQLENGGVDINNAGSLRMRVYHMVALVEQNRSTPAPALQQEQQNFAHYLNNLKSHDRTSLLLPENTDVVNRIDEISLAWHIRILPLINRYAANNQPINQRDIQLFDHFVSEINDLVKAIENQNTSHISWLRVIQTLLIVMVMISAFTGVYLLYRIIIRPIRYLQEGIAQLSRGNLANRLMIESKDEFGMVSLGFNRMADNLQDLYNNLEKKVSEKTAALEEKNSELSALYDITAFLHESHTIETMTEEFLANMIKLSLADAGSIRLFDESHERFNYVCSQNLPEALLTAEVCTSLTECFCGKTSQVQLINHPEVIITDADEAMRLCFKSNFNRFMIFPIQHSSNDMGIMTLYYHDKQAILSQQSQFLIETLTQQLAVALENQQLAIRDKQLAVMEERNLIAQGLHDSIAQSLSFLNLQVQMLQTAISQDDRDQMAQNLAFIERGIQECYEDVRELLLNFRIRINKEDFKEVIRSVLERFKHYTHINVNFSRTGSGPSLNPQQQLQVLFILQEVLSNIRKHAHCTQVDIVIVNQDDFYMQIKDNGEGFEQQLIDAKKARHVGMSIMHERAARIAANITIQSAPRQGTSVTLIIPKEQRGVL